jgi:hypothetical protein
MNMRQIEKVEAPRFPQPGAQLDPAITIPPRAIGELLSRRIEVDDPPLSQPLSWDRNVSEELRGCTEAIGEAVFGGCGFASVRFCDRDASDSELASLTWNLFTMLARPIPQYASGELICRVEVAQTAQGVSHYSASNRSGGYHPDGTLLDVQPDLVGLLGLDAVLPDRASAGI